MSRKQIEHAATEFTKEMFPNINFTDYCLWPMVAVITQKRYNKCIGKEKHDKENQPNLKEDPWFRDYVYSGSNNANILKDFSTILYDAKNKITQAHLDNFFRVPMFCLLYLKWVDQIQRDHINETSWQFS